MTKLCKRCGRKRRGDKFAKNKSTKDGLQTYCRDCNRDMSRERRSAKKDA